jgi:hypothetical protein
MKHRVKMGSGVMIYMPSFIKIGSVIQKLIGGGGIHTQQGDLISLLLFFQNKESKLKFIFPSVLQRCISLHTMSIIHHFLNDDGQH